jgi:hypothetical protein
MLKLVLNVLTFVAFLVFVGFIGLFLWQTLFSTEQLLSRGASGLRAGTEHPTLTQ